MDAKYLNDNVNVALIEALSSMAVSLPEDGVDYIGKYLLQYVARKNMKDLIIKQNQEVEARALQKKNSDAKAEAVEQEKAAALNEHAQQLKSFTSSLAGLSRSKQDAMDRSTAFLAGYLNIPAAYVAVRRVSGEVESLNYCSASPGQEHVVGNKIIKVAEDSEEVEGRVGVSFDAFKLPPAPEEEEEELPDGQEPPPKVVPLPQPLVVDNVMRNARVKFFGIPKLGSFVAVPLSYKSIDHEAGCELKNDDDGIPFFSENATEISLILGMDTIGKYRRFKAAEVEVAKEVGAAMLGAFATAERKLYASHVACLGALKPLTASVLDAVEAVKQTEDSVGSGVLEELDEESRAEQGPLRDAVARAQLWTQKIINAPLRAYFRALYEHSLPAPPAVCSLFFASGCLLGIEPSKMKDACNEVSWDAIKRTALSSLCSDAFNFAIEAKQEVPRESSVASIRALSEAAGLFEASSYPAHLQGVTVLSIWLQKNLTARETAIAFYRDVKNDNIEILK